MLLSPVRRRWVLYMILFCCLWFNETTLHVANGLPGSSITNDFRVFLSRCRRCPRICKKWSRVCGLSVKVLRRRKLSEHLILFYFCLTKWHWVFNAPRNYLLCRTTQWLARHNTFFRLLIDEISRCVVKTRNFRLTRRGSTMNEYTFFWYVL